MSGPTDAEYANRAELAALNAADAAVERLARIIMGGGVPCEGSVDDALKILDALPALLREDSPAGDALRERLGLIREENDLRGQIGWCATCGHHRDRHIDGACRGPQGGLVLDHCHCHEWVREPVRVQVRTEWETRDA